MNIFIAVCGLLLAMDTLKVLKVPFSIQSFSHRANPIAEAEVTFLSECRRVGDAVTSEP